MTKREEAIRKIVAREIKVIAGDLYADLEDEDVTAEDLTSRSERLYHGRLNEDFRVLVGIVAKTFPDVTDDEVTAALAGLL
jgi:hypothetical protein